MRFLIFSAHLAGASLNPSMEFLQKSFAPLRKLYDWTVAKSGSPKAEKYLALLAFAESSFFPIPPDVLLLAMGFSNRKRSFHYASICLLFSLLGGVIGYLIGYGLYESIGVPIISFYHLQPFMEAIGTRYEAHAFLAVFTAAFTPIPYKLITISAGLFRISFIPFFIATILGRGARFFLVAGVIYTIGPKARPFIEKYFEWFTLLFTALLIGGFFVIRYLW